MKIETCYVHFNIDSSNLVSGCSANGEADIEANLPGYDR